MGLSRRKFTKEFKEEALPRLELGASLAELARACTPYATTLPHSPQNSTPFKSSRSTECDDAITQRHSSQ